MKGMVRYTGYRNGVRTAIKTKGERNKRKKHKAQRLFEEKMREIRKKNRQQAFEDELYNSITE